jgi:Ca-activated chloride channel family protein
LTNVSVDFGTFDVFDVEPLAFPDLFSERPILIFGKWRGKPTGKIILQGMTSKGPYIHRLDISKEKSIPSNSALQYLWARHRIAVLSDYNHLRNSTERVKEVTQLGLTYNLLTAYTSFVAIDTEVRLVNGQAVTIKQPLPLPEGVSDYAVGRGMVAQKAAAPLALYGPAMADKSLVKEEESKSHLVRGSIQLNEISTSGEVSKETLEKAITEQIPSLERCYQKALEKTPHLKGDLIFQLVIDSKGTVTTVKLLSSKLQNKKLEQQMIQKIQGWHFPKPEGKGNVTINVTLRLKTS